MENPTYPRRQPITSANFEAAFARIFGPEADPAPPAPRTAAVRLRIKPQDGHRRSVTAVTMADWMRDHPEANTRDAMLVEFTEAELRDHFPEAKRIYSRTLAAA